MSTEYNPGRIGRIIEGLETGVGTWEEITGPVARLRQTHPPLTEEERAPDPTKLLAVLYPDSWREAVAMAASSSPHSGEEAARAHDVMAEIGISRHGF